MAGEAVMGAVVRPALGVATSRGLARCSRHMVAPWQQIIRMYQVSRSEWDLYSGLLLALLVGTCIGGSPVRYTDSRILEKWVRNGTAALALCDGNYFCSVLN